MDTLNSRQEHDVPLDYILAPLVCWQGGHLAQCPLSSIGCLQHAVGRGLQ